MDISNLTAIVLAGGFGTRLRHVVRDVPKPMAPIGERLFMDFIMDHLADQGVRRVILATGHLGHMVKTHYGDHYGPMMVEYSHEEVPLGTGGAIAQAMRFFDLEEALVLNGDTFFPMNYRHLYHFHQQWCAPMTIGVTEMENFSRYGSVTFDAWNRVTRFHEKQPTTRGWINAGTYLLSREVVASIEESTFSMETEIMEPLSQEGGVYALPSPAYFIDIGIPEDYKRFGDMTASSAATRDTHPHLGSGLFLDRDGVINVLRHGDYVKNRAQFVLLDGAVEAISALKHHFNYAFIVTNQQGVGKGLMTHDALDDVHAYFAELAQAYDVHFDGIYAAEGLASEDPPMRKPKLGMGLKALDSYPSLSFVRSVIIGDSTTDIEFGLRLGMYTILVTDKSDTQLAHHRCADLPEAAAHVIHKMGKA